MCSCRSKATVLCSLLPGDPSTPLHELDYSLCYMLCCFESKADRHTTITRLFIDASLTVQVGGPRLMVRHQQDCQAVTAALAKAIIEITGVLHSQLLSQRLPLSASQCSARTYCDNTPTMEALGYSTQAEQV